MQLDLNADVGEGFGAWVHGADDALLPLITSANVACGFHAGDPLIMRRTCERAAALGVRIGAQVGYRDLVGFGRRALAIDPAELSADVLYQLGALDAFARAAGSEVRYLKPHGALYNTAAVDEGQAGAIVAAVTQFPRPLPVLCQQGSMLARSAEQAGLEVIGEIFADRGYTATGLLQPRGQADALLLDPEAVAARMARWARTGLLDAVDGTELRIAASSICVHSDTPGAASIASALRGALASAGVDVTATA